MFNSKRNDDEEEKRKQFDRIINSINSNNSFSEDNSNNEYFQKKQEFDNIINSINPHQEITSSLDNNIELPEVETQRENLEDKKWYQKFLNKPKGLKDGYQFGDLTKASLGTSADIRSDFVSGVASIGENVVDIGANLLATAQDVTGHDEVAKKTREWANKNYSEKLGNAVANNSPVGMLYNLMNGTLLRNPLKNNSFEENSFAGKTTDKIANLIGYTTGMVFGGEVLEGVGIASEIPVSIAGKTLNIPTLAITGGMAGGLAEANSKGDNVTELERWTKGIGSGLFEGVTEGMFGMFGVGGSEITEKWASDIAKKISSSAGKQLAQLGVQASGEAIEEFLSYGLNYLWDNIVTNHLGEIDFSQKWDWNDVGEEMALAFLSSSLSLGGTTTIKTNEAIKSAEKQLGRKLTDNEKAQVTQSVIDEAIQERENIKFDPENKGENVGNFFVASYAPDGTVEEIVQTKGKEILNPNRKVNVTPVIIKDNQTNTYNIMDKNTGVLIDTTPYDSLVQAQMEFNSKIINLDNISIKAINQKINNYNIELNNKTQEYLNQIITEQQNSTIGQSKKQNEVFNQVENKTAQNGNIEETNNNNPIGNRSFEDMVFDAMSDIDVEEIKSPLENRNIETIGKQTNINAYQYDNPEVKPYFQEMAQMIGEDLAYISSPENRSTAKGGGTKLNTSTKAISTLHNEMGYSYEQIAKGLQNIIEDDGRENNAVSKKLELIIDEQLRNGYTNALGKGIAPNQDYINTITARNQEDEKNKGGKENVKSEKISKNSQQKINRAEEGKNTRGEKEVSRSNGISQEKLSKSVQQFQREQQKQLGKDTKISLLEQNKLTKTERTIQKEFEIITGLNYGVYESNKGTEDAVYVNDDILVKHNSLQSKKKSNFLPYHELGHWFKVNKNAEWTAIHDIIDNTITKNQIEEYKGVLKDKSMFDNMSEAEIRDYIIEEIESDYFGNWSNDISNWADMIRNKMLSDEYVQLLIDISDENISTHYNIFGTQEQKEQVYGKINEMMNNFITENKNSFKTNSESNTKLSNRHEIKNPSKVADSLGKDIDDLLKSKYNMLNEVLLRDNTPQILVNYGIRDLPMYINPTHLLENLISKTKARNMNIFKDDVNYHNLGKKTFIQVMEALDNPIAILKSVSKTGAKNSVVIITDVMNKNNEHVIVPVYLDGKATYNNVRIDTNKIKTTYGKADIRDFVERTVKKDYKNLIYLTNDKNKRQFINGLGLQLSNSINSAFSNSIAQKNKIVKSNTTTNSNMQKSKDNTIKKSDRTLFDRNNQDLYYDYSEEVKGKNTSTYSNAKMRELIQANDIKQIDNKKQFIRTVIEREGNSYWGNMFKDSTLRDVKYKNEIIQSYLEKQNENNIIVTDSEGRALTKEQQDFYKGNDVVNENGDLQVVYHGTPFGKFTKFNDKNVYFFSVDRGFAEDYAYAKNFEQALDGDVEVMEVYLKAKNVFDPSKESDIQKLREALPEQIRFFATTFDKETFLQRIQRIDDLPPMWTKEQIKNAKFGRVIGDDRYGYNNDIFIGVNKNNEVVYAKHTYGTALEHLTTREQEEAKEKLLNGEDYVVTIYATPFGQMTEDAIREKYSQLENEQDKRYLVDTIRYLDEGKSYMLDDSTYKISPYTASQEAEHLTDIDNWEYIEGSNAWENNEVGKDVIDIIKDLGYDGLKIYEKGKLNYAVFNKNQIKNVDNKKPTDNPDIRYSNRYDTEENGEGGFYSQLEKVIEEKMPNTSNAQQIKGIIENSGIKQDEIKWIGLDDYLKQHSLEKISKQQLQDYIKANQINIETVKKGMSKLEQYTEPIKQDIASKNIDIQYLLDKYGFDYEKDDLIPYKRDGLRAGTVGDFMAENLEKYIDLNDFDKYEKQEDGSFIRTYRDSDGIQWTTQFTEKDFKEDMQKLEDLYDQRTQAEMELSSIEDEYGDYADELGVPKYERYTLNGGTNYKELLYTLPALSKNENNAYEVKNLPVAKYSEYKSPHWEEKNVLAHARTQDFEDVDGNKVLFIDEVQSDLHQEGRKKGYVSDESLKRQQELKEKEEALFAKEDKLMKKHSEIRRKIIELQPESAYDEIYPRIENKSNEEIKKMLPKEAQVEIDMLGLDVKEAYMRVEAKKIWFKNPEYAKLQKEYDKLGKQFKQISSERIKVQHEHDNLRIANNTGISDIFPFKKNWHEFVLRRLINDAVSQGYDEVAWTTGRQQRERYNLAKAIDQIEYEKFYYHPNDVDKGKIGEVEIYARKNGDIIFKRNIKSEELPDYIGKDLATRILNSKENEGIISNLDESVNENPNSGMYLFYDQEIPNYLNKYLKKWNSKVEEITLKDADGKNKSKQLGFKITDEMRNSIKQNGQPLFSNRQLDEEEVSTYDESVQRKNREFIKELKEEKTLSKREIINKAISNIRKSQNTVSRRDVRNIVENANFYQKPGTKRIVDKKMEQKAGKNQNPAIIKLNNNYSNITKKNLKTYLNEAFDKSIELFRDKTVNIKDTNTNTQFKKSGLDENYNKNYDIKTDKVKVNTADKLDRIIEEGIYGYTTIEENDKNKILYHNYFSVVNYDNKNELIRTIIKEYAGQKNITNRFYYQKVESLDDFIKQIEGLVPPYPANNSESKVFEHKPSTNNSISQSNNYVNTNNVRKENDNLTPGATNAQGANRFIEQEIKKLEKTGNWDNSIPVTRLTDIRKTIEDYLGLGIKKGHFREKAYGIYKQNRDVIRGKEIKDIDNILHETGHALDLGKRLNINKNDIASELITAIKKHGGYEKETRAIQLEEGFAEVIRTYAIIPEQAKKDYPQSVAVLEEIRKNDKSFDDFIAKVQEQTYNYIHQNPQNRVHSNISVGEQTDKTPLTKAWLKQEIMRNVWDKDFVVKEAVKEFATIQGKTTNQIKASNNAYILTRLASGIKDKALSILSDGYIDENGNKLMPGLKKVGEILGDDPRRYDDLRDYLVAKRDIEYKAKTLKTGIRDMDTKYVLNKFKNDTQIQQAAKIIYNTIDGVMQYAVKNGLIEEEAVQSLKESNAFYVPMQRVIEGRGNQTGRKGAVSEIIKKRTGSELDIKDVLENIVANSTNIIQQVENNNILKALYKQGEEAELTGSIYDVIPAPMIKVGTANLQMWEDELKKQGVKTNKLDLEKTIDLFAPNKKVDTKNLITSFINENGKRVYLQFNDEVLFNSLMNMDTKFMSKVLQINSKLNLPLRYGATMANLGFAIPNMISDTAQASIYSNAGFIPVIDNALGVLDTLTATNKQVKAFVEQYSPEYVQFIENVYSIYKQTGSTNSTRLSQYRDSTQNVMKDVYGTKNNEVLGIHEKFKPLKRLLDILTYIPELSEQSTRFRVFQKNYDMYVEKGNSETDSRILAALEARDATQDFGRTGNLTREINQLIPFSSARVGSAYTFAEKIKANPKQTSMRIALLTALAMAIKAIGYDDDEIEELNQRKKDDNFVLKIGDSVVTIKKPQGILRSMINLAEYIQDLAIGHIEDGKEGERLGNWIENAIMDNMPADSVTGLVPNMVAPLIENAINKDFYYNTEIVKSYDLELPDSEQYYDYNSQLAILLGKAFNYSPAKIDNLLSGYFAGLGTQTTNVMDYISGKIGLSPEKPEMGAESNAIGKRFIVNVNTNSASIDEVYNRKTELAKKQNGGSITSEEETELENLKSAITNLSKVNKQIKEIKSDLTTSGKEKAEQIKVLQQQKTDIARQALGKDLIHSENASIIETTIFYPTNSSLSKNNYKLELSSEMKKEYAEIAQEYYSKYESQGLYSEEKLKDIKSKAKEYAKNSLMQKYKSQLVKTK